MKKRWVYSIALTALVSVGTELAVRMSGVTDFPLYDADATIGYIPKASQSGAFLNKNRWQFNAQNMGAAAFDSSSPADTLLVGDSIVLGGNPYREEDRLGPRLAAALKQPVWPVAAGSWALLNELAYLERHPEVISGVERFVFVQNGGDFGEASSWACETTHPRTAPWVASVYAFRRYVYDWAPCGPPTAEMRVAPKDWKAMFSRFSAIAAAQGKPVTFFLYPDRNEAAGGGNSLDALEAHASEIIRASAATPMVYSVGRDPRWNATLYRDGIHASVEGNKVLADIIAAPAPESKVPR